MGSTSLNCETEPRCPHQTFMKTKAIFALLVGATGTLVAADQTWKGAISDSACGASHAKMLAEHKNLTTDRACTLACIKGGSKYVFVSDGKVYNIANQSNKDLAARAGEPVTLTGSMSGDTITVTKVAKE
jgi:hypothetical protein